MPDDHFGEGAAEHYDRDHAELFEVAAVEPAVDFLAGLAGSKRALELGIGTGRIALPLARRGVPVSGIDLSPAMVARLRAKPGGGEIPVTVGDFATAAAEGQFGLVYLVFNTIMNLTTLEEQIACFQNAAAHLEAGGCFVVEVGVPQLQRLPPGERIRPFDVTPAHLGFDEYDIACQRLVSHHYRLRESGVSVQSVPFRYVWPAELDLMARLAGMTLRERWSSWARDPYTHDSTMHVSVWQAAPTAAKPG